MKHMTLLVMLAAALWSGVGRAEEPSLCKSMCDADKRECRAHAHELASDDGALPLTTAEKNPMAEVRQADVPTTSARALENAGTQSRRMRFASQCDDTYLRCTRACAAPAEASVVKRTSGR